MTVLAPFRTALVGLTLAVPSALADDLCVVCSDPPVTYRCQLEGSDPAAPVTPGTQFLCIKEIATRGHHASCSISRDQAASPCNGVLVVLAKPDIAPLKAPAGSAEPPPQIAGAPSPPPAAAQGADGNAPPATMEALAKEAASQTKKDWDNTTKAAGDGVKKAGDTVGSAVKKTWKCLTSLFTSC